MPRIKWKPMPASISEEVKNRFYSKIDILADISACWKWTGHIGGTGYGSFTVKKPKTYSPHRLAYFLHYNKDPKELVVRHTCDNRDCCNPHHLVLGTQKENIADSFKRGVRQSKVPHIYLDDVPESIPMPLDYDEKNLWAKIIRKTDDESCWECNSKRYIRVQHKNRTYSGHRLAYFFFYKKDPVGFIVRHKCDNNKCINPRHLELGTWKDNSQDREKRGRARNQNGSQNSMAKWTESIVLKVRELHKSGVSNKQLSKDFNTTPNYISHIVNKHRWGHI